ncbi:MAG TPA: hypothetical protein VGL81_12215 [Polyangiaceae bacterium]|jgi:hypothetical protein
MRAGLAVAALALVSVAVACTEEGEPANVGVGQPIQLAGAQFIGGDMPGEPPLDGGAPEPEGGAAALGPLTVAEVDFNNANVIPGASGKSFTGLVTSDAVAVGVRLAGMGSGYWVVPVGARDSQVPTTDDFSFSASFDIGDTPGNRALRIVALDGNGNGGTQLDTPVCVEWRIPDNRHECNPSNPVPAVVFSLQWDASFDVDLHVITPDGTDVNPKTNPLAVPVDAGEPPSSDPKIDRDSLEGCVPDGWRQEDLVFPDYPAVGPYDIYADPFASCGQSAVRFLLTIYEAGPDGALHATFSQAGELLANAQTGGGSSGLFITEKQFN